MKDDFPHIGSIRTLDNVFESEDYFWIYEDDIEIRLIGVAPYDEFCPCFATLEVSRVGCQVIFNVRTAEHDGVTCFVDFLLAKQWAEHTSK
jgi:hypothetical protein